MSDMAGKTMRIPQRQVRNLRVKNLSAEEAKHVKGGPIVHPGGPREVGMTSLLLPAVQKVRE
jgi:hypothetical protein